MEALDQLAQQIRQCQLCPSIECRGRAVPFEGLLLSAVLFLGRNPGREEFKLGRPFVGPGGKCLDSFIQLVGVERSQVMIANMVCCFTTEDRPPVQEEIDACRPFNRALIGLQRPKLIVALGKQSLQSLVNTTDSPSCTHGKFYEGVFNTPTGVVEAKVMASWHPGSAVRSATVMKEFLEDAAKVKTFLAGT